MPETLRVTGLLWHGRGRDTALLDGIDFSLGAGETLLLRGRSGCGRSALLELCAGLLRPDAGEVYWDGVALSALDRRGLLEARRRLGFVFQAPALISNMTIGENIALPLRGWGVSEEECALQLRERLLEHRLDRCADAFPESLPLAAQRHAALARALIGEPSLLLLDELTAGLDAESEQELLDILQRYRERCAVALLCAANGEHSGRLGGSRAVTLASGRLHPGDPQGIITQEAQHGAQAT